MTLMGIRIQRQSTAVTAQNHWCPKLYSTKASNDYFLAGLLTYSIFEILPIKKTVDIFFKNLGAELTAAGLFRIFTGFPFKSFLWLTKFRQR